MDDAVITAYDEAGRVLHISRAQWATEVLPNTFAAAWDDADQLHRHICMAIDDGFAYCARGAIRRLLELEPVSPRTQSLLPRLASALDVPLVDDVATTSL